MMQTADGGQGTWKQWTVWCQFYCRQKEMHGQANLKPNMDIV